MARFWMTVGLLAIAPVALAAPPVTPEEAARFHEMGMCSIKEPGTGLRRADGHGWIVSPLPGKHRLFVVMTDGRYEMSPINFTPGEAYKIRVLPAGAPIEWCPVEAKPPGRDECGPVPSALLWDARRVGDPQ
jgi:hypothetical protein